MTGTKDYCTPLKAKGIKIAILYTEYFPLPTNSWYRPARHRVIPAEHRHDAAKLRLVGIVL